MADLILPRRCIACGKILLRGEHHLCLSCAKGMPLTYFWTQSPNAMADRYNAGVESALYEYATALYFYREGFREISKSIKYDGNLRAGRWVGAVLGRKLASSPLFADADLIVPVPLHRRREWKRGYNQAEIIARGIARGWNGVAGKTGLERITVACDMLERSRHTKSQTSVDIAGKKANVSGAFSPGAQTPSSLGFIPRHILLVDDVFTTGSTLGECHDTLRRALMEAFGPATARHIRISAVTLACVSET